MDFKFKQIGIIRAPYTDIAPYQPIEKDKGNFRIIVGSKYKDGLFRITSFRYIYLIYYIDRLKKRSLSMKVTPPWADKKQIGLFASRSPLRPNPIGISIVRIKKVKGRTIFTSGLDVFDKTPLLDIKPYVKDLDSKDDANYGWITGLKNDRGHLLLHIKGIPHEY